MELGGQLFSPDRVSGQLSFADRLSELGLEETIIAVFDPDGGLGELDLGV